jgi:Spx/MgsR family transcriptional regulator
VITVWGLKNCDTCKKARKALDEAGADYAFKDVRADAVGGAEISGWLKAVGGDVLINRRGTTWRGLSDADKARGDGGGEGGADGEGATELLAEAPALIKRPVFVFDDGSVIVGFGAKEKAAVEARL